MEFGVKAFAGVRDLEVTAISRGAESVVASTAVEGSLALSTARDGSLLVELAPLDTEAGRRTAELVTAGIPIYSRPLWDSKRSTWELRDGVAHVERAVFSYLLTRPVPSVEAQGWEPMAVVEGRSELFDRELLVRTFGVEVREAESAGYEPRLFGTMLHEGRAASGGRRELFAPGSVSWPAEGVALLTGHGGGVEVRAHPIRHRDGRITVSALATAAIRAAVEGGRRFMSVEFRALEERTTRGGVREVLRALVDAAALVADPEYDTTEAEVRARGGRRLWL